MTCAVLHCKLIYSSNAHRVAGPRRVIRGDVQPVTAHALSTSPFFRLTCSSASMAQPYEPAPPYRRSRSSTTSRLSSGLEAVEHLAHSAEYVAEEVETAARVGKRLLDDWDDDAAAGVSAGWRRLRRGQTADTFACRTETPISLCAETSVLV